MQMISASPNPVRPGDLLTVCYSGPLPTVLIMTIKTAGGMRITYEIPLDKDHPRYEPAIQVPMDAISIVIHDENMVSDDITVTVLV